MTKDERRDVLREGRSPIGLGPTVLRAACWPGADQEGSQTKRQGPTSHHIPQLETETRQDQFMWRDVRRA